MEYLRKGFILKLFMVSVLPTGFYNSSDTYGQRKLNSYAIFMNILPSKSKKKIKNPINGNESRFSNKK